MLIEAMRWLRDAGVTIERLASQPSDHGGVVGPDAILLIAAGDAEVRFAVEEKRRAPYPNEIPRLSGHREALSQSGQPLLVVPFVSEALGPVLGEAGWSWADECGNFDLRAPGLVLRQRHTTTTPRPKRKSLPQGSGGLAIIRALIRFGAGEEQEAGATALAAQAKVSQPRASQVLRQLHELKLIDNSGRGRLRPNREALLDRFLAEYRGPGGSEQYLYSLDPPTDLAVRATSTRTGSPARQIVVSADVGPDLILAWRRPTTVVLYTTHEIDPDDLGLVEAQGSHDANVIVRIPEDRSVFPVPELVADVRGVGVPLADPSQMIWDLQDLGGADRLEAAGMLHEWLLTRP
ncbi:MAG: hypothetical protein H0W25_17980 [Acidimicrobiia bacterium]|nr:hypothetical protein [Acidimicrobiia bacterium]